MKTVSAQLRARVDQRVNECVDIMKQRHPVLADSFKAPNVTYDINSARLGGQACGTHRIRLNPVFLNSYTDHYIKQTVGHEMAHILVKQLHPMRRVQSHGPEWKSVMRTLGLTPDRCHSYEVPDGVQVGKQVRKHSYKCSCCEEVMEVGPKVHNKLQRGAHYWHRACGRSNSKLIPVGAPLPVATPVAATLPTPTISKMTILPPNFSSIKSKLERCRTIAQHNKGMSRQEMITAFALHGGCTPQGAATYFYTIMKDK